MYYAKNSTKGMNCMEDFIEILAEIISEKTGIFIDPQNVFQASRHFHYIPETDPGKPLFLYYCYYFSSGFGVEINSEDWHNLKSGIVTPEDYVNNSNWYYGYLSESGSIITGGYIQALENTTGIHDKEKILRYMTIITCRGDYLNSGYVPKKDGCFDCPVKDCPYSAMKKHHLPMFVNILEAFDNRLSFYNAMKHYVQDEYGYTINGICCSEDIGKDEIVLYRNVGERTFELYLGDSMIKELFYTPFVPGENWVMEILKMKLYIGRRFSKERILIESKQDFQRALIDLKYLRDWDYEEERLEPQEDFLEDDFDEEDAPIHRFFAWLLRTFCK